MNFIEAFDVGARSVALAQAAVTRSMEQAVGYVNVAGEAIDSGIDMLRRASALPAEISAMGSRVLGAIDQGVEQIDRLIDGVSQTDGVAGRVRDAVKNVQTQLEQAERLLVKVSAAVPDVLPGMITASLPDRDGEADAPAAEPHLLMVATEKGDAYRFGLSSAAYNSLKRVTDYNVASQDRLTRRPAQQAVAQGGETITVRGAIYTTTGPGAGQIDALRAIGLQMVPLLLTTGYGEVLGNWYLVRIEEEQEAFFADGAPRKQGFTLEFKRYGDDLSNV